jgi:DNA helicase MCM9
MPGAAGTKRITDAQYRMLFRQFLLDQERLSHAIEREVFGESDMSRHVSVTVSAQDLLNVNPQVGSNLLEQPAKLLPLFDEALVEAQQELLDNFAKDPTKRYGREPNENCHVRVSSLPQVPEVSKPSIGTLRSSDAGRLVQLNGTVIRTGVVKMLENQRVYVCKNTKCRHRFTLEADVEQGNILVAPKTCPSNDGGGSGDSSMEHVSKCKSTVFEVVETRCSDYQEIKLQDKMQYLMVGSIPRSIIVVFQDDLVDKCMAGDDIAVTGTLLRRWKSSIPGVRAELDTLLVANSVKVRNKVSASDFVSDELRNEFLNFWKKHNGPQPSISDPDTFPCSPLIARNLIIESVCPQLFGLFIVKLALLLTMAGGNGFQNSSGHSVRGDSHMLLIGDPGTGKSQLLRFAAFLSTRSVLTTGIGTTSAGLTCSAVKDGGDWMLEAGALVLADGGLCCIDEFNSIREHDRSAIHEAMEQQTLSVAKAGLVCKLNARCSVFAVSNPKGNYDVNNDVSVNTGIASPLLSRFDVILVLLDTNNPEWDQMVSTFILQSSLVASDSAAVSDYNPNKSKTRPNLANSDQCWPVQILQAYLAYVKELKPELTRGAMVVLESYYLLQRKNDARSAARTTVRLLESLIRLSQAHARIMCRRQVLLQDALMAILVVEASLNINSMLGMESVLHTEFPADPDAEYAEMKEKVLSHLGLDESDLGDGV